MLSPTKFKALAETIDDRLFQSPMAYAADRGETALIGRWLLFLSGGVWAIYRPAKNAIRPVESLFQCPNRR